MWGRPFGAEELRQVRRLKARAEQQLVRRGLEDRELKRGKGGIRDIEFAVQLLQLVHGRADPELRSPATLPALRALASGGYVGPGDATALADAYVFLRTVEHRLQLQEDQQVHTVPDRATPGDRLARVLGYRDRPSTTGLAQFEADLRRHQATVRGIHERLFFRPLLEAFTAVPSVGDGHQSLSAEAVEERLRAFGFADAERTYQAVRELTPGFSRVVAAHATDAAGVARLAVELARSRPRAARVCAPSRPEATTEPSSPPCAVSRLKAPGNSASFSVPARASPGRSSTTRICSAPWPGTTWSWTAAATSWRTAWPGRWRGGRARGRSSRDCRLFASGEQLRIAARDVLDLDDVHATGEALSDLAEVVVAGALRHVDPGLPFAVIGMGRLGGRELAYASDLDLMFVYEAPTGMSAAEASARGEAAADAADPDRGRQHPGDGDLPGRHRAAAGGPPGAPGPEPRGVRGLLRALGSGLGAPGPPPRPGHRG